MRRWGSVIGIALVIIGSGAMIVVSNVVQSLAQETPSVIINELAWAGSSANSRDEWIELKNIGNEDVDLTGWQITKPKSKSDPSETLMLTIGGENNFVHNTIIPQNGYFLISHYGKDHPKTVLDILSDIVANVSLSNTNLQIKLYDGQWDDGREPIDVAGDMEEPNKGEPLAGDNGDDDSPKASMIRVLPPGDGTLKESWSTAEESQNLKEKDLNLGTPENSKRVIAHFSAEPQTGSVPLTVTFDASETINLSGGDELKFYWNFEGEEGEFPDDAIPETAIYEYTYENTGSFWAGLRVTNDANFDDTIWLPIEITGEMDEPPQLFSVVPNEVEVGGILEIEEIVGVNFSLEPVPSVQMIRNGQIIEGRNVKVASENLIDSVLFDISNAEVGAWDLKVTNNPDGQFDILNNAIQIIESEPTYDLSSTIRINEIYPKPSTTSNDEFIELYNFGDTTIDLTGWKLDDTRDGGSNAYNFVGQTLSPKSFLVLYKPTSRLTLNDNGDSVSLIQPNGFVLDEISYDTARRGESLSRFDNGFEWTETITPNGENVFFQTADELPEDKMEEEDEPEPTEEPVMTYEIDDLLITELLPNPTDSQEEFIEIFNNSAQDISLLDWKLRDKSGKSFTIGENDVQIQSTLIIKPNQFVYITQSSSKIHLNNTGGEMVELISPNDVVITSVSYPDKAPAGASYSHFATDKWTWTSQATPGKINVVILDEETEIISKPIVFLPSVGVPWHRWMGIGLMSFFLASMLMWYKRNNEIYHK